MGVSIKYILMSRGLLYSVSQWVEGLFKVYPREWVIIYWWIPGFFPHTCSNNGRNRLLSQVTLLSLWVILQVSMAREGPARWKLPMTCLYCSNMLPMATLSEKVTNITVHCYNPFTTVSFPTLSIYLIHASGRKYNNPKWVYIMWPHDFVILQFYRTCAYSATLYFIVINIL